MTTIRLSAAAATAIRDAKGPVLFCDETGAPLGRYELTPLPDIESEPQFTEEEWRRIINEPGGKTTAEVLEHLRNLGKS